MFYQENEIITHKYLFHVCQAENFTVCLKRQRLGLRAENIRWAQRDLFFWPEAEDLIWKGSDTGFKADDDTSVTARVFWITVDSMDSVILYINFLIHYAVMSV